MIALTAMFIMGYCLGMFNAAWLVHRVRTGSNLASEGSGNLGARNLYDVSGNLWISVFAGVLDAAKGAIAVIAAQHIHPTWYQAWACAGIGSVVGHNYNVFLKGKGGRGLATALGVGLVSFPGFVVTWACMYLVGYYIIRRNLHVGAMTATIATVFIVLSLPEVAVLHVSTLNTADATAVRLFASALCIPIFLKHIQPIRDIIRRTSTEADGDDDEE